MLSFNIEAEHETFFLAARRASLASAFPAG
jgi:hypothetical protein